MAQCSPLNVPLPTLSQSTNCHTCAQYSVMSQTYHIQISCSHKDMDGINPFWFLDYLGKLECRNRQLLSPRWAYPTDIPCSLKKLLPWQWHMSVLPQQHGSVTMKLSSELLKMSSFWVTETGVKTDPAASQLASLLPSNMAMWGPTLPVGPFTFNPAITAGYLLGQPTFSWLGKSE